MISQSGQARRAIQLCAGVAVAGLLAGCNTPGMGGFEDAMGRQAGEAMGGQLFGDGGGSGSASGGQAGGWGASSGDVEAGEIFVHQPGSGNTMISSYPYDMRENRTDWFVQGFLGDGQLRQHLFVQAPRGAETEVAAMTLEDAAGTTRLDVQRTAARACDSGADCAYLVRGIATVTEGQLRALTGGGGSVAVAFDNGSRTEIAIQAAEIEAYLETVAAERQAATGS